MLRAINFFNVITKQARAHLKFKAATTWTRGERPRKRKSHPKRDGVAVAKKKRRKKARASNGAKINNRGLIGVKRRKLVGGGGGHARASGIIRYPLPFSSPGLLLYFFH